MRNRIVLGTGVALTALLAAAAAVAGARDDRSDSVKNAIEKGRAKNVILLIGDGMGDSEITIARNDTVGAAGRLALDRLPLTGQMTTYSVFPDGKPDYDPESASTSTAWSTGKKTVDGRIGTSPSDQDLRNVLELAQKAGYRTGNVSTADITDATPAGAMAHIALRGCQGPLNMNACPQDRKSAGGPAPSLGVEERDRLARHLGERGLGGGLEAVWQRPGPAGGFVAATPPQSRLMCDGVNKPSSFFPARAAASPALSVTTA